MRAFFEKLAKIRLKQAVYPFVLISYLVGLIVLFTLTAGFLTESINRVFGVSEATIEGELLKVDIENFHRAARKLGITVLPPIEAAPPPAAPEVLPEEPGEEVSAPPEDKATLKIAVLNSTGLAGLAGGMRDILTGAGFAVARIGNQSPAEAATLVKVKVEKQGSALVEEIFGLVSGKYPGATAAVLAEGEEDVVIVIGSE